MDEDGIKKNRGWGGKTLAIIAILFLAVGFYSGTQFRGSVPWDGAPRPSVDAPDSADLAPFFKAWQLLDEHFVSSATTTEDAVTKEEKVWGAIQGLAASYGDPYTEFFPPKEKDLFDSQVLGNFGGVGMEIEIRNGVLTVASPLKDTPAYKAGVKSGDLILKIDGEATNEMDVNDAVSKIRGEAGTKVVITFARDGGAPFETEITRQIINLPTVDTKLRDDGVFVITLYSFNAAAPDKFRQALREFADSGSDKMIIDLRGNPGGYLEAAVDIASWYLPVGKTVVTEDSGGKRESTVYRSRGYDVFSDNLKLAILIDSGSASASEILAGALHDHGIATLVGQKSFGKGSVQQVFDVTDKTSIKITIAKWLTPAGISISHQGITPDIEVELTKEDIEAKKDPQLERAAEFLKTGK
jgi:carboxyl-terminal processing protease